MSCDDQGCAFFSFLFELSFQQEAPFSAFFVGCLFVFFTFTRLKIKNSDNIALHWFSGFELLKGAPAGERRGTEKCVW